MEEKQSGSQYRSLRDSCIDFEIVGLCTINHCTDLAVVVIALVVYYFLVSMLASNCHF